MNELLKLINEYEEEWIIFDEVDDEECFVDIHPCTLWTEYEWHLWFNNANKVQFDKWMFDRVALSKEYGFIKWLVDNDKIDLNEYPQIREYSDYESLLMYLSIQDEPIEFLISILK